MGPGVVLQSDTRALIPLIPELTSRSPGILLEIKGSRCESGRLGGGGGGGDIFTVRNRRIYLASRPRAHASRFRQSVTLTPTFRAGED